MTLEYNHRLSRLHQERFIFLKVFQRLKNGIERFPGARRFPAPPIDDELFRFLSHFRIKIVLDHAISGFTEPVLTGEVCAPRGADCSRSRHEVVSLSK